VINRMKGSSKHMMKKTKKVAWRWIQ
jgi:hypothetical protein